MAMVTHAVNTMAILLAGSTVRPEACGIGTGSAAEAITDVALVTESDRNLVTTTSTATAGEVKYTTDFGAVEMSGTAMTEFGMFPSGTTSTGSLWNREGFAGVNFDGTTELQVQITYKYIL